MRTIKDNYIKRELFDKVTLHLKKPQITIITGARRVGKTVLLKQIQNWLIEKQKTNKENIIYFNLDIFEDRQIFQSQAEVIRFLKARLKKKKLYFLVDEAQRVKNAGLFFKGIYDLELPIKMIFTGSSTLEIAAKMKESLAGRKRIFHLYPFSFSEFLLAKGENQYNRIRYQDNLSLYDQKRLNDLWKEYATFGGYPEVVLENNLAEKKALLGELFSAYVEKDIISFLKIEKPLDFSRLVRLLAGQIGQLININELATNLNLERITIEKYLKILEETFIIKLIRPFFRNSRQEIIKMPKVYFLDNGILNYALGNFANLDNRPNKGSILENSVFIELLKSILPFYQIKFWRTQSGSEVDFVITANEKPRVIFEVKYLMGKKKRLRSVSAFNKKYQPKKVVVFSLDVREKYQKDNFSIQRPYSYLLKNIDSDL